ncbi:ribosome biogenesis GTPase YlqF [Fructilactobacillus fructivorans]|uniref:Ribosome biogenesis GTPase A n=1 Tax=Fructilactobacillus fructivorans TaxID=1614 RepID=A0A0C1PRS7_9LACO|nr:ribosome biogenesis GTPase YlqF [Fructilactobacillus fructivorans]KID42586.1 50S ribosomal subunit maturation GTPase [Fructilactobacillus fructivorans]MCT0151812.1 ribosome biogenesis GTPase YlqF [Fructilactobacillus fructivorans]MCT2868059.1 ribosome biogenesis GTPase YlqF [Fructilactobacillus fructivorans]MCT2868711.1 ribosome biogenesis GTPase YlqF [Fructilactobacillus fructivorans]MCT2873359.1 ribosome biogenesis GTPase YlqF [Fructilactobacillus fructivorans]
MGSNIQWFPGHMAKAIRQFEENVHVVDIIFELVDARIPYSSVNPEIKRVAGNKPRLFILTKSDLADPKMTQKWLDYFNQTGLSAISIDSKAHGVRKKIEAAARQVLKPQLEKSQAKGIKKDILKAVCVGVPNVGKSTLLNQLVSKRSAAVGNRPGVTKGQQWLTSSPTMELLDTPGILWPKFQNQEIADKLALTGAIKESIYHPDDIALFALHFFRTNHEDEILKRYHLNANDLNLSDVDLLLKITEKIGMKDDYDRASIRIINDVQKGKLGRFTLDSLELVNGNEHSNDN